MKRLSKGKERGATSGYMLSIIVLAVLLIGGVLLLKNIGSSKSETGGPVAVETGEFKADETEDKTKDKTETTSTTENDKQSGATTTNNTAENGYTPENLAASGPEDFVIAMIGIMLAGATIYVTKEYIKSRSMVKSTLLGK